MKMPSSFGPVLVAVCLAVFYPATGQEEAPPIKDLTFVAANDGTIQRYVVVFPESFHPNTKHDVLIALHGAGSDRWQFVKDPRDECRAARDVASEHRMLYVSPDYRAPVSWMGPQAEADLVQIIAELKEKQLVGRVFLCGGSMGGSAALTFAAVHPHLIDGVASMNGTANYFEYENYQDTIRKSFGGTKKDFPMEYKKRSAEYWPEKLTMPVGFTVSGKDTIVPPDSVRRLAAVLHSMDRAVKLIDRPERGHATQYADAKAILQFVIQRSPVPEAAEQ